PRHDEATPARALELVGLTEAAREERLVGPTFLGHQARHRPVRHRPDLARLDWTSACRRRTHAIAESKAQTLCGCPPAEPLTNWDPGGQAAAAGGRQQEILLAARCRLPLPTGFG